ncbi:MAG TPA: type II toxin-antitoxin system RelE/ParE family toxin [Sphingomicrobium sp.]|jgi:toxin ParE1/3/4|nr:type II toxin-antitoxin system RelE/ParE family toxin [Sphingomicrobium sp.]
MSSYFLGPHADNQLDEIYEYTAANWGEDQADRYINTLFEYFSNVSSKNVTWRSVPAEFGVVGHFGKCEHHFIYWRALKSGDVGIVAILHERMHKIERIQDLFRNS